MDIEDFDTSSNDGAIMQVRHPSTGSPLVIPESGDPVTITLTGVDSSRYQKIVNEQINRRLKNASTTRNTQATAEDLMRENIDVLVACTVAWTGISSRGANLECTPDNARVVYARLGWLRQQAKDFIEDRANFLKASATT